jgi:hypothetical protein
MQLRDKKNIQSHELLSNGREVLLGFNRDLSKGIVKFPWLLRGLLFPQLVSNFIWKSLLELTKGKREESFTIISDQRKIFITELDEGQREIHAQVDWCAQQGWFSIEWTVGRVKDDNMDVCFELCNLLNNVMLFGNVYIHSFSNDIKVKFYFHQDLIQYDKAWALNAYRKSFWEAYYLHQPFDLVMKNPDEILQIFDNQINRDRFRAS